MFPLNLDEKIPKNAHVVTSSQVNKTVDIVFVIESLGKERSQKPNLTTREEIKMHKNTHLLLLS